MNAFKRICTCRKSCNRIIVSEKEIVGIILKDQLFKSNYQTCYCVQIFIHCKGQQEFVPLCPNGLGHKFIPITIYTARHREKLT